MIAFCRRIWRFQGAEDGDLRPTLPKTSTGKIQKFLLRNQARSMDLQG
jgi:acyl-coenzyme A synthetase/AMP-(fatty) acid ligase